ncbi:hypothetical protein PF008_g11608 [Phytophthora fragariae]|uniref:Uncharacterized protein n=1 Tax=Phytophthora fragariae TaxID=53985 RepID=A0A6G0RQH2_9STRA|nr:hypothetical protein PF008_g11608 [Phytophthora fragariae]
MTLEDTDDACVYVKESVLRELEQERRRLKWQLSRALQTSDVRAAELEASKAKVKDLLTIVEVNKGVADHVVQRSQGRETKRRAELETLHQQNKQQRQRYVDLALRSMSRRVRDRQKRDAFHSLQQAVLNRSRRREALLSELEHGEREGSSNVQRSAWNASSSSHTQHGALKHEAHWQRLPGIRTVAATAEGVAELGAGRAMEAKTPRVRENRFGALAALGVCRLEVTRAGFATATRAGPSSSRQDESEDPAAWFDLLASTMC